MQKVEFETLTVNSRGEIIQRNQREAGQFVENLGGGICLEMVAIPGGIFNMGSPGRSGYEDEHPQHPVSVKPFLLGRFAITQEQWQIVTRKKLACRFPGPRRPLERVSWDDAQAFCRRLDRLTGRAYRLPSEAEWEYACRAQTTTPFYCGATLTTELANYVGEHLFADEPRGVYRHVTTEVGSFAPNDFGLYDMLGNVWEWCADAWHDDYSGAPLDGSAWDMPGAPFRVVRGGSWHETPNHCRCAVRLKFAVAEREDYVGFRVALSPLP